MTTRDDPAYWRAKAASAREGAHPGWTSDPQVRAQVDAILSVEPAERIRQLQAEVDLFASAVRVDE